MLFGLATAKRMTAWQRQMVSRCTQGAHQWQSYSAEKVCSFALTCSLCGLLDDYSSVMTRRWQVKVFRWRNMARNPLGACRSSANEAGCEMYVSVEGCLEVERKTDNSSLFCCCCRRAIVHMCTCVSLTLTTPPNGNKQKSRVHSILLTPYHLYHFQGYHSLTSF